MKNRLWLLAQLPRRSIGAEVGVWKGNYSAKILKQVNPTRLYLIDPWAYMPEYNKSWYGTVEMNQSKMNRIAAQVTARFAGDSRVIIKRTKKGLSVVPAKPKLDWVYIDGDHTYKAVKHDLQLAKEKVKSGGLICGDDFGIGWWGDGVVRAVREFVKENRLNWELRGSQFVIVNDEER